MELKVDIENVVKHLFEAYPFVDYIALNPGITITNEEIWERTWYFVGFLDLPTYKILEGYPAWVGDPDVDTAQDEYGAFFLNFCSDGYEFRGVPIQRSPSEYASPRFFCWARTSEGMVNLYTDEVELDQREMTKFNENFKDMMDSLLLKPAMDILSKENPKTILEDKR